MLVGASALLLHPPQKMAAARLRKIAEARRLGKGGLHVRACCEVLFEGGGFVRSSYGNGVVLYWCVSTSKRFGLQLQLRPFKGILIAQ